MPLYLNEPTSAAAQAALERDFGQLVSSQLALVELRSALARLQRQQALSSLQANTVFIRIEQDLLAAPRQLELSKDIIRETVRLLNATLLPLGSLDALHIATCLRYGTNGFVTGDKQQAQAAKSFGLTTELLIPPP